MTPIEREMVKKWFTAYVVDLAKKGKSLSREETETAKSLGVYTGQ